jgi:hypothetical protein
MFLLSTTVPFFLCYAPLYWLYALTLRPPRTEATLPSLSIVSSCLLRLFHYFTLPLRERYSLAFPLASALLLAYEFTALHAQLERQQQRPHPASSPGRAAAASAAAAATAPRSPRRPAAAERTILDLQLEDVWRWTDLPSYLLFTLGAAIVLLLLTALVLPRPPQWYSAGLGGAAVACEATLGLQRLRSALAACCGGGGGGGAPPAQPRQRASYLGLLAALACAGALLALPPRPLPAPLLLAPCLAAACEAAVVASSELPAALAALGVSAGAGAGSGRAQKAV